jgi:hypothetical protein
LRSLTRAPIVARSETGVWLSTLRQAASVTSEEQRLETPQLKHASQESWHGRLDTDDRRAMMIFARRVFLGAGIWGIIVVTPMYFLFDTIGRQRSLPITYPQFYYGFLAVTLAWQFAFLAIGSDPVRYRLMMIPGIVEKLAFVLSMGILYVQGRVILTDIVTVSPDLVWGTLFIISFAKTSASAGYSRRPGSLPVRG